VKISECKGNNFKCMGVYTCAHALLDVIIFFPLADVFSTGIWRSLEEFKGTDIHCIANISIAV